MINNKKYSNKNVIYLKKFNKKYIKNFQYKTKFKKIIKK